MYATADAMIARFGEDEVISLSDRAHAGVVDAVVLGQGLADASALIDGYLASRYSLPLSTIPPMLEPLCCDIARYKLATGSVRPTDEMRKRYEDAIAWLVQVASGKIGLGVDPAGAEPAEAGGSSGVNFVSGRPRVFDAGSLGDFGWWSGRR